MRQAWFGAAALLLGLLMSAVLTEIILRVLGIGYGVAPLESDPLLHHVHPQNYSFTSHSESGEYGGHIVRYDAERRSIDPGGDIRAESSDCRIAFLGDSFTEAGNLAYSDSFIGRLAGRTECQLDNWGTTSYSPIFFLLQWEHKVRETEPDVVIVQIYNNDIRHDAEYFAMAEIDDEGNVTAVPGPGGGTITKLLRKSYLVRLIRRFQLKARWIITHWGEDIQTVGNLVEENPDISNLSGGFIADLANRVEQSGSWFLLWVVPSKVRAIGGDVVGHEPEFSDKWRHFADSLGLKFVDMVPAFHTAIQAGAEPFYPVDIHFNETGHEIVANVLGDALPELFDAAGQDR